MSGCVLALASGALGGVVGDFGIGVLIARLVLAAVCLRRGKELRWIRLGQH